MSFSPWEIDCKIYWVEVAFPSLVLNMPLKVNLPVDNLSTVSFLSLTLLIVRVL